MFLNDHFVITKEDFVRLVSMAESGFREYETGSEKNKATEKWLNSFHNEIARSNGLFLANVLEIVNEDENGQQYMVSAYEFETGLLMVIGDDAPDQFFKSRSEYQPMGRDTNVSIDSMGMTTALSKDDLLVAVVASANTFGPYNPEIFTGVLDRY